MTQTGDTEPANLAADSGGADTLLLPKVSVIIVNYNYNDYLTRAFDGAANQTYPNVEILIVDDKSTDGSQQTIDKICAANPHVIAIKSETNGGQSIASLKGLSASSGSYIVFLDADDQLLPECVEAHLYAHLSSRIPVPFTTVDILNNAVGKDINMSHAGFSEYVESERGRRPKAIRCVDQSMPNSWFGKRRPPVDVDQMHFVMAPHVDWVWSPTSANCFRRDAVNLILREPGLERIRWGTDAYLIRPLSALFGSLLIDRPLVRYIIHTENRFIKGAPLNNFHAFDTQATSDHMRYMARSVVERLMSEVAQDGFRYPEPRLFFDAMRALSDCFPGPKPGEERGDFFDAQLLEHRHSLTAGFGEQVVDNVFRSRFGPLQKAKKFWRRSGLG